MITKEQLEEILPTIKAIVRNEYVDDRDMVSVMLLILREKYDQNDLRKREEIKKIQIETDNKAKTDHAIYGRNAKSIPQGIYIENRFGANCSDYLLDVSAGAYPEVAAKTFLRNGEGILVTRNEIHAKLTPLLRNGSS